MNKAVLNWRTRAEKLFVLFSTVINNCYEAARALWIIWGEGKPYSWKRIREKWFVFKNVEYPPIFNEEC